MKGVIVLGEVCEGELFIDTIEYPDGTRRTTHFVEKHGRTHLGAIPVEKYVVHFDDDNSQVNLYKKRDNMWFLDE